MDGKDFEQLDALLVAALERPSADRPAYLDTVCAGQPELRRQVESLMAVSEGFLETPAFELLKDTDAGRAEPVTLAPATRLGPYEILSLVGKGGMGQVYKAKDTRLDRTVAVKILPSHLAVYPQSRARFDREARTIAQLDHPHICALLDVGEQEGTAYLVMPYLEGEALVDRLAKGALPLDQALTIAIQISDALDRAHRAGIIHRDLKPGNIFLTKTGPRLLDFGLAKPRSVRADAVKGQGVRDAPLTGQHCLIGTPQYMSPEQIRGKDADHRVDIWAFGCILYEMVSGRRAFDGESCAGTLVRILEREPTPLSTLQPRCPPVLDRLVQLCLAKDPADRWQNALDARRALEWTLEGAWPPFARRRRRPIIGPFGWSGAGALLTIALWSGVSLIVHREQGPSGSPVRFVVGPPANAKLVAPGGLEFAVSPDGRTLALIAASPGAPQQLWVRPLGAPEAQAIAGTETASSPFWSPDSKSIGFFADAKLKVVEVDGAAPRTICGAIRPWGGTLNGQGVIVFAEADELWRISIAGGPATKVTTLNPARMETSHRWPQFLTDGRHFLFQAFSARLRRSATYVAALGSTEVKPLSMDASVSFAPPDHLLFMRDDTLMEQRFDVSRLREMAPPGALAERVGHDRLSGAPLVSASHSGVLTYREGWSGVSMRLTWVDLKGGRGSDVGPAGEFSDLALSPDLERVAFTRMDPRLGTRDIWILNLARGAASRITRDPANDWLPVWSPDGTRVIFASDREGVNNLYEASTSGAGPETVLHRSPGTKWPLDWSRDGRFLLFTDTFPDGNRSLWALPLSGDHKPQRVLSSTIEVTQARFSPDGRWIAYVTRELGRFEVAVTSFPTTRERQAISTDGGTSPLWRSDSKELFYLDSHQSLMSTAVVGHGRFGRPRVLFHTGLSGTTQSGFGNDYVFDSLRQRFLVKRSADDAAFPPITVVLNWTGGLKK